MLASSFFFTNTASTMPSTLSLHDALPIFLEQQRLCLVGDDDRLEVGDLRHQRRPLRRGAAVGTEVARHPGAQALRLAHRSEEHTSELQSHSDLVCRLLLEKKNSKPDHQRA